MRAISALRSSSVRTWHAVSLPCGVARGRFIRSSSRAFASHDVNGISNSRCFDSLLVA